MVLGLQLCGFLTLPVASVDLRAAIFGIALHGVLLPVDFLGLGCPLGGLPFSGFSPFLAANFFMLSNMSQFLSAAVIAICLEQSFELFCAFILSI